MSCQKHEFESMEYDIECGTCGEHFCQCEEPRVTDDDWDLGPACGLDPEVCESCQ